MYNLYVAEKRQQESDDKVKKANDYLKYRKKFKSKKKLIIIFYKILKNRTNSNNVQKL
jgi:hypothetical protein